LSDLVEARTIASDFLRLEWPRRWKHVVGVSRRGREVFGPVLDDSTTSLLEVAGLLHDIGYSSRLQDTGFHPIDGARYLRSIGYDRRVVNLVAHHSFAYHKAQFRGLGPVLVDEFPKDPDVPHDELCFLDLTTSPSGGFVTVEDRLVDIQSRYGHGSAMYDFVEVFGDELRSVVRRMEVFVGLG